MGLPQGGGDPCFALRVESATPRQESRRSILSCGRTGRWLVASALVPGAGGLTKTDGAEHVWSDLFASRSQCGAETLNTLHRLEPE